ncbi:hypothetical protein GCM10010425_74430 [Streptomyces spororaveus]|uniref:Uncharacterized protein n=1 Tax=Streptomyces spororaveus TaxID=284039 RepID=A0ABQ3T249_9ACTN|nr:hypothetical protein [Streptomyces spororaveus]GHI74469.1 hypothetical protein Sspor_00300 [Streptomyces spororaveus]
MHGYTKPFRSSEPPGSVVAVPLLTETLLPGAPHSGTYAAESADYL